MQTHGIDDNNAFDPMVCQIDHTVCDFLMVDSDTRVIGRPILQMAVDAETRAVLCWRLMDDEPPSGSALIEPYDPKPVPEILRLDNGRMFASCDLVDALHCVPAPAPAPASKPVIERLFRTLE